MFLEKLTIGSDLASLLYAYLNNSYYLPTLKFGPLFYQELDFAPLLNRREDYTYSRLLLVMSLSGKLLNYEEIENVKITGNQIKISSKEGFYQYSFGVCNVFDPTGIQLENEIISNYPKVHQVYDDYEVSNLGAKHLFLPPKVSKDNLGKKIHFYNSSRVDGANYVTDCVVESILTTSELMDVDYSDSIVRFIVIRYLTSLGIHGNFMNLYKNGKPKYRKPRVKHKKRIIVEKEMNEYQDSVLVKFKKMTIQEVINEHGT